MGVVVDAQRRSCPAEWTQLVGGTKQSAGYPCDRCGAVGVIDADHLDRRRLASTFSLHDLTPAQVAEVLGSCECGGSFDKAAPTRCPACGSTDVDLTHDTGIRGD